MNKFGTIEIDTTITLALISSTTAVLLVLVNYYKDKRMKLLEHNLNEAKSNERKVKMEISVLNRLLKISVHSRISNAVNKLIHSTNIDRYMIFVAVNGVTDFNKVAIIFEKYRDDHKKEIADREEEALALYRSIPIDDVYKSILKGAELYKQVYLNVETMQQCMLKDIYLYEGVMQAAISFLFRERMDDNNDVVCFCSAAIIGDKQLTEADKTKLKLTISSAIIPAILEYMQ
ncbi:hypothetical protein F0919_14490 [Taibaiella lutea]|uniref:Uncharacterized protein n=1 Tax=Taibaiella lutea TaxID=2608001 RepID=A0A5M6CFB4_9BACT|nr:hypothetical protein [Taibaiella lutea]KAA5533737.1 hypothetical protein F0919_14490 [Taibaiella lutea]